MKNYRRCFIVCLLIIMPFKVFSYYICIDPGHGYLGLNGWGNCGPVFNVNGETYRTLKQPKNNDSAITSINNTINVAEEDWPLWEELKKNGSPVGLLEYQNTWKIANYLEQILINRNHTVINTKKTLGGEHANPTFQQRAQVALDNNCDFMISIHTNAPGNGTTTFGLFYAKSHFRVEYYRVETPPPTPVETDFSPAAWNDDFKICKIVPPIPSPESMPYVVGDYNAERPVWLRIEAVTKQGTPAVPFDPDMVRYKIAHQGSSSDENKWMPAGNDPSNFVITHRQSKYNTWAVAARYDMKDEFTPTPTPATDRIRNSSVDISVTQTPNMKTGEQDDLNRQTPTPVYFDGVANVVLRGPHQSDTSENIAKRVMSGIASHPETSGSTFLNVQGNGTNADWHFYNSFTPPEPKHLDLFVHCSKWIDPNEQDRKEIPVFIVECGFHTNADYEAWLYHNDCEDNYFYIAQAIANGIDSITDSDFENRPEPTPGSWQQYADLEDTPVPGDKFFIDTKTIYVYSDYNDCCGESYGSPCAPYKTITDAMCAAWDGATIKVARGTYSELLSITGTDYNIILMGGYDPITWERDISANPTIIEIDSTNPLIYLGDGTKSIIDGFEIRGNANAIEIANAQPVLKNNTISSNHGHGVNLSNCNTGILTIENNLFKDCNGSDKAGIRIYNSDNLEITKNIVTACRYGIICTAGSNPAIRYNEFASCDTGLYISEVQPDIWGNIFTSNSLGISVIGLYDAGAIIRNNLFLENTSAGIYVAHAEIDIINNTFDSNFRGILYTVPTPSLNEGTIVNCIFSNNTHSGICALNDSLQWPYSTYCDFWQNGPGGTCDISIGESECDEISSGYGRFKTNPLYTEGPNGDYYLTQTGNQCVNGGSMQASEFFSEGFTTDPNEQQDTGVIDVGFHYRFPTATPIPSSTPTATATPTPTNSPEITQTPTNSPILTNTPLPPPTCRPTFTSPPAGSAFIWPDSDHYYSLLAQSNVNLDDSSYYSTKFHRDTPTPVVLNIHVVSTEDTTGFNMDVFEIIPGTGLFDTSSTGTNLGFINGVSDPVSKLISVIDGSIITVSYDDDDPPGIVNNTFVWHEATWTPSPTPEFTETPTPTSTSTPEDTASPTNTPSPINWSVTDRYGYQGERIPCGWHDASDGIPITITGDDTIASSTIPFDFYFYDQHYASGSTVTIGSNGLIGFSNNQIISSANQDIPDSDPPNGTICLFWDDLYLTAGSVVYTKTDGTAPDRRLTIEWVNSTHYANLSDDYTFELILFEGSNNIEFHYNAMHGEFACGYSASVGIENHSGEDGLQFSSTGVPGYIYDCLSLRFTYPGTPTPTPTATPTQPPLPTMSKAGIVLLLVFMGMMVIVFSSGLPKKLEN